MTESAIKCNDMQFKYIFILAILFLANCSDLKSDQVTENISNENTQSSNQTKIENETNEIQSMQSHDPIVEIKSICRGACGMQPSEYLDFLLFSNGKTEYDFIEETEKITLSNRKLKKLKVDEIENIRTLVETIFSSKIKTEYKADYFEDVFMSKKITLYSKEKKKTFKIIEGDVLIHSNRNDKLPQNLIDLIKEIEKITDQKGQLID